MPILDPILLRDGLVTDCFALPETLPALVAAENWAQVDRTIGGLTTPQGTVFQHLLRYHSFRQIEFILSIRDATDPDQEDGIWHDDGSRFMAFTLSLTPDAERLEGGKLGVRRQGASEGLLLATPPFGHMLVYLTGHYGFEHRIHRVTRGRRVVIAGWCSGGP